MTGVVSDEARRLARRLWWAAGLWLAAIYSTLYAARFATEWLRAANLLRLSVGAVFVAAVACAVWWARRRRLDARQAAVMLGVALVVLVLAGGIPQIEERLHFVQYGVLAALVYSALRAAGRSFPSLWAIALTALAGLGDEGIQHLLPNRYFGWNDVRINALAGALVAVGLAWVDRLEAEPDGPGAGRPPSAAAE